MAAARNYERTLPQQGLDQLTTWARVQDATTQLGLILYAAVDLLCLKSTLKHAVPEVRN
jgi:hypothetical protein